MITNPFQGYGNPIKDPTRFYEHAELVGHILGRVNSGGSTAIIGERRIGKSSLLYYLAHPATSSKFGLGQKYRLVYVDLQRLPVYTPLAFWQLLLRETRVHIPDSAANLSAQLEPLMAAENYDFFAIEEFYRALPNHIKLVYLLDEFERVTRNEGFTSLFYDNLRALVSAEVVVLITASRRKMTTYLPSGVGSPFFNIFETHSLRLFTKEEVDNLCRGYLEDTEISFDYVELGEISEVSGNFPFFIQMAASFLFTAYQHDACKDDRAARIQYMRDKFINQTSEHFDYYWKHSDTEGHVDERISLLVLALKQKELEEFSSTVSSHDLKRLYGRVKMGLNELEERSLIVNENDNYKIFSPVFRDWILHKLTDMTTAAPQTLEEWTNEANKGFAQDASDTIRKVGEKISPDVRDVVQEWLLDAAKRNKLSDVAGWIIKVIFALA